MIHKFEKFNDYTHELDQLEDIFSNIDFDLNVKRIKSDIQYEGIIKKDIPKFIIHIEFSGKNKIDLIFQEIDKKVIASESFGYSMSHAKVCFIEKSYNFEEVEDCFGFDDPTSWIIVDLAGNHEIDSIHEFNRSLYHKIHNYILQSNQMKIRKFNESNGDERSWIRDFIDDLELDFPGIETEFDGDIEPTGEVSIVKINLPCKKEPSPNGSTWITLLPDDEMGWSRRNLLKYIEDKVNFLTDSIEGLDLYQYLLIPFSGDKSLSIYDADISSFKFINKIKLDRLQRLQKIRIKFYITG